MQNLRSQAGMSLVGAVMGAAISVIAGVSITRTVAHQARTLQHLDDQAELNRMRQILPTITQCSVNSCSPGLTVSYSIIGRSNSTGVLSPNVLESAVMRRGRAFKFGPYWYQAFCNESGRGATMKYTKFVKGTPDDANWTNRGRRDVAMGGGNAEFAYNHMTGETWDWEPVYDNGLDVCNNQKQVDIVVARSVPRERNEVQAGLGAMAVAVGEETTVPSEFIDQCPNAVTDWPPLMQVGKNRPCQAFVVRTRGLTTNMNASSGCFYDTDTGYVRACSGEGTETFCGVFCDDDE